MKRILETLLLLAIVFNCSQIAFAETEELQFTNSNITITIDYDKWGIFDQSNYKNLEEYKNDGGAAGNIYSFFDETDSAKLVAVSHNEDAYWTFAAMDVSELSSDYEGLSETEKRSLNLSDYTDDEVKEYIGDRSNVDGFEQTDNAVNEINGAKYSFVSGYATVNGYRAQCMQVITIVNGYYYCFTLYPEENISDETQQDFADMLSAIEYKPESDYVIEDDANGSSDQETDEDADRVNALKTAALTVVPFAILIGIIRAVSNKRKRHANPVESESTADMSFMNDDTAKPMASDPCAEPTLDEKAEIEPNTLTNDEKSAQEIISVREASIPAEELRMLKELLDDGVITQEDFEQKKKKLLDLL